MKTLFTAEVVCRGGRSGTLKSRDGLLDVVLGNPLEAGLEKRGPNPELLFAGAYAACYQGALNNAAKKVGAPFEGSKVEVRVSLVENDQDGYQLAVELHGQLPGVDHAKALQLMQAAHETCPYSKALRGDVTVALVVDSVIRL
jgi:Ohr subfamily peroxiredoxin